MHIAKTNNHYKRYGNNMKSLQINIGMFVIYYKLNLMNATCFGDKYCKDGHTLILNSEI